MGTLVRPGPMPDFSSPGGGERWHYCTLDGRCLEPPAYLYQHPHHPELPGWFGAAGLDLFPDGYSRAGPATREHIMARIEARLLGAGWLEIIDRPEGWALPALEQERAPFERRVVENHTATPQAELVDLYRAVQEWFAAKKAVDGAAYLDNFAEGAAARVRILAAEDRMETLATDLAKVIP